MKRRILIFAVLALVLTLAFASCQQKAVKSLEITDGLERTYNVGDTPDFSGVKIKAIYNDGSTTEIGASDVTFGSIDTSTAGTKDLTITYKGITITVQITVKATVIGGGDNGGSGDPDGGNNGGNNNTPPYTVFDASYDANITAFYAAEGNKTKFRGETNKNYIVGSINPFRFTLSLDVLDNELNPQVIDVYESTSKVYLIEGETETLLEGAALAQYVVIDETAGNNSFDFTDAAIGKTFKLVTRPVVGATEDHAKELVVDVVDAYNIYDEKELNIVTNYSDGKIGWTEYKQLDVVNTFLANNNITRPENLKGIVLHRALTIETDDIPDEYFYTLAEDLKYTYTDKSGAKKEGTWAAGTKFLTDVMGIYSHIHSEEAPEFSIYGNYFTINTNKLPCVAPKDHGGNNNDLSGSELFRFDTPKNLIKANGHENYKVNINGIELRDDDGSDDDNSASMKHMLGLVGIKTYRSYTTYDQVNIYSYFVSIHVNRDCQTTNINDCDFYNAWNNHIMIWSDNDIDGNNVANLHANHTNITVNVTGNSRVAKCGGPVIINMVHDSGTNSAALSNADVNLAEGTEVYSYVSGQEAWFAANGATDIANMIKSLNGIITPYGGNFLVQLPESGDTTFFNAIMVNMTYITGSNFFSTNDINGSFAIGDDVLLDMNTGAYGAYGDPYVSAIASHPLLGKAPIFRTSEGVVVFGLYAESPTQGINPFTMQPAIGTPVGEMGGMVLVLPNGLYEIDSNPSNPDLPVKPHAGSVANGEYLTLYYNNIGLVFGYNEENITEY